MKMEYIFIVIGLFVAFYILTSRTFWLMVFGLGAVASVFAMAASVISFSILPAVGFFVLAFVLWRITKAVADGA